jgi:glutathione S-transferase
MSGELTVYSRHDCHLCDKMIAALQEMRGRFRFELRIVDVDSDPELARRHGERVPVLVHGERELCHHFLDRTAVMEYVSKMR